MTLRSPFHPQQLLFGLALFLVLARGADGQDLLVMQTGQQVKGRVTGANPTGVQVTIDQGQSLMYPMNQVKEVRMTPPREFFDAQKALEQKNYDGALAALQVINKFRGLPADWVQQGMALMGEVQLEKGDNARAESVFADFQKLYPGSQQADVGLARLAMLKKDINGAKAKLQPILEKAAKDGNFTRSNGALYAQACYAMGLLKEGEGDFGAALENYLKASTVYYQNRGTAVVAQEKADALRKSHPLVFIP